MAFVVGAASSSIIINQLSVANRLLGRSSFLLSYYSSLLLPFFSFIRTQIFPSNYSSSP
jgi:hypothetical protein